MKRPEWVWEFDDTPGWGNIVISLRHRGGMPWDHSPVPRRIHRCWAQTEAQNVFQLYCRCACGAIRMGHLYHGERIYGRWIGKNARRRP